MGSGPSSLCHDCTGASLQTGENLQKEVAVPVCAYMISVMIISLVLCPVVLERV